MIVNDSCPPALVSWALLGHTGLEFFVHQPLAEERAEICLIFSSSAQTLVLKLIQFLLIWRGLIGSADGSGSTLLQWHQCCLPTKILTRTTLRCFLPVLWEQHRPSAAFLPSNSQFLGQEFTFHPCLWALRDGSCTSFTGQWHPGNVHYCTLGERGAVKHWDLPLQEEKWVFHALEKSKKLWEFQDSMSPGQRGVWKHYPWPRILPGAVLPKEQHQEPRFLIGFTKTFTGSQGLSHHCPLGGLSLLGWTLWPQRQEGQWHHC